MTTVGAGKRSVKRLTGRRGVARRERWLRGHPLCAACYAQGFFTRAEEVDHVQPLSRGGKDDESNLQSLCKDCHGDKTRLDLNQRERAPAIGVDGWPIP